MTYTLRNHYVIIAFSYVVGFGDLYPQRPHHRGASCPQTQMTCGDQFRDSGNPNPNILFVSFARIFLIYDANKILGSTSGRSRQQRRIQR